VQGHILGQRHSQVKAQAQVGVALGKTVDLLFGVTATLGRVEDLVEMVKLGVMTTPSVTINGKLVVSARVPKVEKLVEILKENM
jgi:hypothetical protein